MESQVADNDRQKDEFYADLEHKKFKFEKLREASKGMLQKLGIGVDQLRAIAQAIATDHSADAELFKGRVQKATSEAQIQMQTTELQLKTWIEELALRLGVSEKVAGYYAQQFASLVAALNVSASVGHSTGESTTVSYNRGAQITNTLNESTGES